MFLALNRISFYNFMRNGHHLVGPPTSQSRQPIFPNLCRRLPCSSLSTSFLSFLLFFSSFKLPRQFHFIYILLKHILKYHARPFLNKLKPPFLNSPSVIINYTQFMIFHLTKNSTIFVIKFTTSLFFKKYNLTIITLSIFTLKFAYNII